MTEFLKKDRKRDLLTWIQNYEKKKDEKMTESNEEQRNIFEKVYKNSDDIRKFFFDNYLSNISNNLNTKSSKDNYSYKDFFKREEYELNNKYNNLFKSKKVDKYKGKENIKENNQNKNNNYNDY